MRTFIGQVRPSNNSLACDFVRFDHLAGVRKVNAGLAFLIAFALHAHAAHTAQLSIPGAIRMVLAHPADAEADATVLIH
jgi:hypothetical protein